MPPAKSEVVDGALAGGAGLFSSTAGAGKFFGGESFANRQTVVGGAAGTTANTLGLGFNAGRANLDAILNALDQTGLITVLAQPNLSAMSGETASFLAGGEFPVPIPSVSGSGLVPTISIEWKKFGVGLNFVIFLHLWTSSIAAVKLLMGATAPRRVPCLKPLALPTWTSVSR